MIEQTVFLFILQFRRIRGICKEQQAQGNNCPICFTRKKRMLKSNDVYRVRPDPFDLQGGMNPVDARDEICKITKEFNANGYHGFDPMGQDQGIFNIFDVIQQSTACGKISANPIVNWGGVEYTQTQVEDEV